MMKITKRLFAFLLVAVMLATTCVFANAQEYKCVELDSHTIAGETAYYQTYQIDSGEANRSETAVALTFDPADGYMPMAFAGYAGTSGKLATQYAIATQKYGYDVIGLINGAFFSMDSGTTQYGNYGTLVGIALSNGKIQSAHAGYTDSVVAFGSDGSMNIVKSSLDYKLYIKGQEIPNGIYYINKTSGSKVAGAWNDRFYYYDTSCGRVCDTYEICPGYEVICEKVENTDLCVGSTLKGKVLEVRENSYGAALAEGTYDLSNKFVLFVKSSSANANYVKDLVEGDTINIAVNETIEESKEIMEKANSVITNVGWLVKDGVDQTRIVSTIGTHSVTLAARWTAFGQKEDGSFVYFTSEGGSTGDSGRSITLRDVAKFMMDQGCVNVIRMDGGGSSGMYVKDAGDGEPGYIQLSERSDADCILVVKKSSVRDADLEAALQTSIDDAKAVIAETPNSDIEALVAEAEALLASDAPVSGDVRRYIQAISGALSGKEDLEAAVIKAGSVSFRDYSEPVLAQLRAAYKKGTALIGADDASLDDIKAVTAEINELLTLTGANAVIHSTGKSYTASENTRTDVHADDGVKLTDGSKGYEDAGTGKYSGWGKIDPEIVVDLGEAMDINYFRSFVAGGNWGITVLDSMEIYVSEDGTEFKEVADSNVKELISGSGNSGEWNIYTITATTENTYSARYVKFKFYGVGQNRFVWVDEVEAGLYAEPVTEAIEIKGFNTSIAAGDTFIFTSAQDSLDNVNLNWTGNLLAEWDEELGEWVVKAVAGSNGSRPASIPQTLNENQIVIGAHDWETGVSDGAVPGSALNKKLVLAAKVGQIVKLHGIDIASATMELGAYVTIVDVPVDKPNFMLGDVNNNGKIDAADYALVKRTVLKTHTLTDEQLLPADVNGNGKIDAADYALIKRHVLKTYDIFTGTVIK